LKLLFSEAYVFLQYHRGVFFQRILVKLQHFFLNLSVSISEPMEKDELAEQSKINPKYVLCLAKTALFLESETVDHVSGVVNSLKYLLPEQEKEAAEDITINTADLRNRLKTSAEKAIRYYIKLQSGHISQMLRKGMEAPKWLRMPEARAPRDIFIDDILPDIRTTYEEILQVFEDRLSKEPRNTPRNIQTSGHTKNRPSYSADQGMLFLKKIRLGQEIEFSSHFIISEIVKVSLKSFLELIRSCTFGKTGYNQMQVDIYFLRGVLSKTLPDEYMVDGINTLLDLALHAAMERSLDTHGLEQSILIGICEPKIADLFSKETTSNN
jgi:hypothetical protein